MNKKPLVLIVEDFDIIQQLIIETLDGCAEVIAVKSYNAAARAISEHGEMIVAVTLDYNILKYEEESTKTNSEGLVPLIRHECGDIPIFAASGEDERNNKLVALGCRPSGKKDAGIFLRDYVTSREWV